VDGPRQHLLAGAGLALQQHRGIADLRRLIGAMQQRIHAPRCGDKAQAKKNLAKSFRSGYGLRHGLSPERALT